MRADLSEWMDEPCSYEEFRSCLVDLEKVNRTVLSYRPTLAWLERIPLPAGRPLHIVDVGSGGGDMLRRIEAWANDRGLATQLVGIDLNPYAARAAREASPAASRITWLTGDAFSYAPATRIDVVISSLFTHHLPDTAIAPFVAWMERSAQRGWFINDLHRGRGSYYVFRLLARMMHWHPFVRHDGPISIRRSFTTEDWSRYCGAAGIAADHVSIYTSFPGRLCVSRVKP